ncbi:hypothetical protein K474DRAFT_359010 [Panus rudis PR-1116 ss-1]|nr:hypothetical protein K474DRAFT_359010 [Panus rudis PR-1116 ss-1]
MSISPPTQRKPQYKGTNGFTDPVTQQMQGAAAAADEAFLAQHPTHAQRIQQRMLNDAVEKHRFAGDILQLKGDYFPSLTTMRDVINTPDTAANLKARIRELQERHREDLRRLYDWQADDYFDEALDEYLSRDYDDSVIEEFYQSLHRPEDLFLSSQTSQLEAFRHAYFQTLLPLIKEHISLSLREAAAQKRQDATFPSSIAEFRAIPPTQRDYQLRYARYLTSDKLEKEHMMNEFRWAWRQTQPLIDEYERDESFRTEMQELVRQLDSKPSDPRRRPLG